jgi:hypothetical protein
VKSDCRGVAEAWRGGCSMRSAPIQLQSMVQHCAPADALITHDGVRDTVLPTNTCKLACLCSTLCAELARRASHCGEGMCVYAGLRA